MHKNRRDNGSGQFCKEDIAVDVTTVWRPVDSLSSFRHPIIVNIIIGSLMTLIGFKIYVPPFASDEARDRFYTRWSTFFKVGA